MQPKQPSKSRDGRIPSCQACSHICGYGCCTQVLPQHPRFGPEEAVLLYPGEWEGNFLKPHAHFVITNDDFYGGKLAYCNKKHFDQSKCDGASNFKPLDCESYPFAPAICDGKLVLLVDSKRCPLTRDYLSQHYCYVLAKWQKLITEEERVLDWIRKLELPNYMPFDPTCFAP